jgi:hypothetical protein
MRRATMMMETNSLAVDVCTTNSPTIPLRITLALSPDPNRDYSDVLRDIIDLAFEASASLPVEIIIVDPADSEQAMSDEQSRDVHASVAMHTKMDKQMRGNGMGCTQGHGRATRLETRAVAV